MSFLWRGSASPHTRLRNRFGFANAARGPSVGGSSSSLQAVSASSAQDSRPAVSVGHFVEVRAATADDKVPIKLHYAESRPAAGATKLGVCVLLHGFPDFHGSWRNQMQVLAEAGYHVIAPDMRGYGRSSKPWPLEEYSQDELTADIAALVSKLSPDAPLALLCGHDWGAFVAWAAASDYPGICAKLAILNVPHTQSFANGLQTLQHLKSWYIFVFQTPFIPELIIEFANAKFVRWVLQLDLAKPLSPEELGAHAQIFASERWASHGPLQYYRAAACGLWRGLDGSLLSKVMQGFFSLLRRPQVALKMPPAGGGPGDGSVAVPVQVIWGVRDRYLGEEMADPPRELVPNARPTLRLDACHWVHWDKPAEVNEALLTFLREE